MNPATPTPLPDPGALPLEMPDVSLWDMAPHAIQTYNSFETAMIAMQAFILLIVIYFILKSLSKYARNISVHRNDNN